MPRIVGLRGLVRAGLVFTLLAAQASAADCVASVLAKVGKASPADRSALLRFASTIDDGSPAHRGLFAVLEQYGEDGAARAGNVLTVFGNPKSHFERIPVFRDLRTQGLDILVDDLTNISSPNKQKGAAATLRWASDKMSAGSVGRFEVEIPGGRPDIIDTAGNLLEVKYRDWDALPDFLWDNGSAWQDILEQATNAQSYAAATGKQYSLVFEVPIPSRLRAGFNDIFAHILSQPNVTLVNGF